MKDKINKQSQALVKGALALLFAFLSPYLVAQEKEPWLVLQDELSGLRGYQNQNGDVMIEPKFSGLTSANVFRNIIMVTEELTDGYAFYYLHRSGRQFGKDSMYILPDTYFDCEQEGHIRFRDQKTDRAGLFDSTGKVRIPAIYNDLSPIRNGMFIGLKGAQKTCEDGKAFDRENPCEHWAWKGGRQDLINLNNEVLVEGIKTTGMPDWWSMSISDKPETNPTKTSQKGKNGQWYHFTLQQQRFARWFSDTAIAAGLMETNYFHHIYEWQEAEGAQNLKGEKWRQQRESKLNQVLVMLKKNPKNYSIYEAESPDYDFYRQDENKKYFSDCADFRHDRYPVFEVMITDSKAPDQAIGSLHFILTEKGYQLYRADLEKVK